MMIPKFFQKAALESEYLDWNIDNIIYLVFTYVWSQCGAPVKSVKRKAATGKSHKLLSVSIFYIDNISRPPVSGLLLTKNRKMHAQHLRFLPVAGLSFTLYTHRRQCACFFFVLLVHLLLQFRLSFDLACPRK